MKMNRRTEITVETHEVTTIRVTDNPGVTLFCEICGVMTLHISVPDAAAMLKLKETAIFDLVQVGKIHLCEAEDSAPLVCADSILPLSSEGRQ